MKPKWEENNWKSIFTSMVSESVIFPSVDFLQNFLKIFWYKSNKYATSVTIKLM